MKSNGTLFSHLASASALPGETESRKLRLFTETLNVVKTALPIEMLFRADSCGPKIPCVRWGSRSRRSGAMFGVVQPAESIGNLCCGVRSKMDHSRLNNGMAVRLYIVPVKMCPSLRCSLSSKFLDYLLVVECRKRK